MWCATCREPRTTYEVQMTDVNIALQMLCDAEDDRFDAAILVSGDSDLVGPVRTVLERHPGQQVGVAFPPRRNSVELETAASFSLRVHRTALRDSQLPDEVAGPDGFVIRHRETWR